MILAFENFSWDWLKRINFFCWTYNRSDKEHFVRCKNAKCAVILLPITALKQKKEKN
jgi:hypothetical protein